MKINSSKTKRTFTVLLINCISPRRQNSAIWWKSSTRWWLILPWSSQDFLFNHITVASICLKKRVKQVAKYLITYSVKPRRKVVSRLKTKHPRAIKTTSSMKMVTRQAWPTSCYSRPTWAKCRLICSFSRQRASSKTIFSRGPRQHRPPC